MPVYVYVCSRCGQRFDKLLPMSRRDEVQICPNCQAKETRRVMTAATSINCTARQGFS